MIDGYANLKLVGDLLPADEAELARLRAAAGDRLIVTAASTHPGEDPLIASAVEQTGDYPLLVIVPRHPVRGPSWRQTCGRTTGPSPCVQPASR